MDYFEKQVPALWMQLHALWKQDPAFRIPRNFKQTETDRAFDYFKKEYIQSMAMDSLMIFDSLFHTRRIEREMSGKKAN